ncbi:NitT/TauT family transport system permease protein [Rhizobiales bacterium GAS191]|jgi:ABC-type nitrate/sulfonate/bicarbonate transport system permease component|nr:NitT/TauT family transport system permease protein [Rhizobiales bacterium GAS113]SED31278.1 NitT/TauT family transport system permease protein [Rhizobiales bacterium GAS191]
MKGLALPLLLVAAAELAARFFGIHSDSLAAPSAVAAALYEALRDGSLLTWSGQTIASALMGLGLGGAAGLALGIALGLSPRLARCLEVPIELLRPIPSVALLPVALLIFGFGFRMEVAIIAFACFWPVAIIGSAAIAGVEPRLMEVSRSIGLRPLSRIMKIVLPAALPRLFVAFRLAAGVSLIVAVTVEIAINPLGLGYALMQAQQTLRPELMFAVLIWVGVIGWGLNFMLLTAQHRLFGPAALSQAAR